VSAASIQLGAYDTDLALTLMFSKLGLWRPGCRLGDGSAGIYLLRSGWGLGLMTVRTLREARSAVQKKLRSWLLPNLRLGCGGCAPAKSIRNLHHPWAAPIKLRIAARGSHRVVVPGNRQLSRPSSKDGRRDVGECRIRLSGCRELPLLHWRTKHGRTSSEAKWQGRAKSLPKAEQCCSAFAPGKVDYLPLSLGDLLRRTTTPNRQTLSFPGAVSRKRISRLTPPTIGYRGP